MFELKVLGVFEASLLMKNGWPTRVVSLIDPNGEFKSHGEHHIVMQLHDIASHINDSYITPTREHLDEILDFTKDLTHGDKLLVHCHMGVSRSTAIACGILIQHGMTYQAAYEHVRSVRDCLLPNTLFVKYIDEKFGLNGNFIKFVTTNRTPEIQQQVNKMIDRDIKSSVFHMKDVLAKLRSLDEEEKRILDIDKAS